MKNFLFIVCLFLVSCGNDKNEPLIEKYPNLEEILFDIHLARSASMIQPSSHRDSLYAVYLQRVAIVHDLEADGVDVILEALKTQPKFYTDMLQRIDNRLRDSMRVYNE